MWGEWWTAIMAVFGTCVFIAGCFCLISSVLDYRAAKWDWQQRQEEKKETDDVDE